MRHADDFRRTQGLACGCNDILHLLDTYDWQQRYCVLVLQQWMLFMGTDQRIRDALQNIQVLEGEFKELWTRVAGFDVQLRYGELIAFATVRVML